MKTIVILASGPSLTGQQIAAATASGHHVIAVNATYKAAPQANTLYSGDFLFFKTYITDIRATFKGAVWTQDSSAAARWPEIRRIKGVNREGLGREHIHINGNSGAQAINLAYLWKAKRIVLLGYDMKLGPKGERHHHADHPKPCVQNQTFLEWMHKLAKVARDLKAEGVDVVNCTPGSAMTCFRMGELEKEL